MAIIFAFRIQGWDVLISFGENTRYDLVVDRGNQLRRVQCKTGRLRHGAVVFRTCSSYAHHPNLANNQAKGVRLAAPYEIAKIDVY